MDPALPLGATTKVPRFEERSAGWLTALSLIVLKYPNALLEGEESGWHSYRKTCPPFSAARGPAGWESAHLRPIGLKSATIRKKVKLTAPAFQQYHVAYSHSQICENPDLHLLHSQFFGDYRPVEGVWPVFTVNTAEGYGGELACPSPGFRKKQITPLTACSLFCRHTFPIGLLPGEQLHCKVPSRPRRVPKDARVVKALGQDLLAGRDQPRV